MHIKVHMVAAIAALLGSTAASAITYTASRDVGAGTADISITTDGTLGVLSDVNIVDYVITVTNETDTFTLDFGTNSDFDIVGTAFSATATDLLFNFDAGGIQYALFQNPGPGSAGPFFCLQTDGCFDFGGPGEGLSPVSANDVEVTRYSGVFVVASADDGPVVPEPATWAMMIAGFGMIGASMRRYSAKVAA